MISRFNLDQKRLNYYENLEQFNKDFVSINSSDNKMEFTYDVEKPSVLFNKQKTLKLSIYNNDKESSYILFSNQSISILPNERVKVHKALKDVSEYEIFNLNIE